MKTLFLDPNPEKSLQVMALFEGDFSIDWIQELSGLKASQIIFALEQGMEQDLLTKKEPGLFCFKNNKIRRKLSDSLNPEEKDKLHRLIANIILRDIIDEKKAARYAASHLLKISNNVEDCRWLLKAGELYRKEYQLKEALQCYTKVISELGRADGAEEDWFFVEGAIGLSKVSEAAPDLESVISHLQQALEKAINRDHKAQQALLELHLAKNEWLRSNYDNALMRFDRGWSMANVIDDPKLKRSAITFSTFFPYWQGRFRHVIKNYEEVAPEVEKYVLGKFPLLSAHIIGSCYAMTGQVTQGMSMLYALQIHCRKEGDYYVGSFAGLSIGVLLLELGRIEESIECLKAALNDSIQAPLTVVRFLITLNLGLAYYQKKDREKSIEYLNEYLQMSPKAETGGYHLPLLMAYGWAMEQGDLPEVAEFSLEKEIGQSILRKNVFVKGIAYRYQALLSRKRGQPPDEIISTLLLSLKWLEESGHQFELVRTRIELSREYLSLGKEEEAKDTIKKSASIIDDFVEHQVPDDLRFLLPDLRTEKNLLKEIMKFGQELVAIREKKDLMRYIISIVNRITGAERGAIFLLEENDGYPKIILEASKNLVAEDIRNPSFLTSMEMIERAAKTGKGQILSSDSAERGSPFLHDEILSRICAPMKYRDKLVGVLYFDNRFFISTFKESDLEILDYFAAQAAIAIDNSRAYEGIQASNLKLIEEKLYYEEQQRESLRYEGFIGQSSAITRVLSHVDQVAGTNATVLILGETGVGKEIIARAIHRTSPRHHNAFIRVNCSSLPDSLIPSELFGHEKGSFTGAINQRIGRFELADGGTLFLDEIGEIPLDIQVRLLRVLQSKEFERVGGKKTIHSDFRLVVATNRDLQEAVTQGKFREDLFYRLNVFPIIIPPLRERKEDIPLLTHYFLKIFADKLGKTVRKISETDMDKLLNYDWPGNVRELENVIERGMILSSGSRFTLPELNQSYPVHDGNRQVMTIEENEREHILWTLKRTGGKIRGKGGASELLKIHPNTLYSRMKKLEIRK